MSGTKKEKENSPVNVFQKQMQQSAVPPLEANKPCWYGDHAIALTAAEWSVKRVLDEVDDTFQINNLLSLPPPEASWKRKNKKKSRK